MKRLYTHKSKGISLLTIIGMTLAFFVSCDQKMDTEIFDSVSSNLEESIISVGDIMYDDPQAALKQCDLIIAQAESVSSDLFCS